jgi:hypothetical protein
MSSPTNRRTAPYVIMNNHSRPPSVAYSARQPDQEQLNTGENGIQTLTDAPHQDELDIVATTTLFNLVRRAQVCLFVFLFCCFLIKIYFSECIKFCRCKYIACYLSLYMSCWISIRNLIVFSNSVFVDG